MPNGYEVKETILSARNISVSYGDKAILKDLNLQVKNITRPGVEQGQVIGLLGPSGVGKTTLFRCLAGLMKPDTGEIRVTEKLIPVERGMVGVVAQHYPLFSHRTVLGNLAVAGRQAGLSGDEANRKAMDLLKRFGIEEQRDSYPVQLSGGQRQRVAIAQQFMCSDHFLLMDEPFSGLDLIAIQRVSDFICEIAQTDELKTIIIVTHDIDAALAVCDTVWLLGRDHDATGKPIPGARIQQTCDLAERGLAWRKNHQNTPEFLATLGEVREAFTKL
ncbi:MAG: ABC transporter ATP-binding protein [Fibrella sp.]|nr:ABC transporter ATP-binding protein [Armatimonadota bacterium]